MTGSRPEPRLPPPIGFRNYTIATRVVARKWIQGPLRIRTRSPIFRAYYGFNVVRVLRSQSRI